ncbi:unnamed protein product [Adineta steineri]|uniref:Uncharacterized protein n=1 Tax=Adineta steineri TaxID=433720 RepID=A0A814VX16_9BILA|nr:unnamed protein product [Adineta steineri]CAF3727773.1 unnamed protein product [Adineta steineri]
MTKRLRRLPSSSSSSSSEMSLLENDEINLFSSVNRIPCRTKVTGRYQSDMYTGLISTNRMYSNGKLFTRLEQLITIHHDDQIRSLLLILRHYSLKHQWTSILYYLKSLLQSTFCRAYMRLYWQLIFRYLIENFNENNQIDLSFLSQIFENLFHSPTIDRTQTFYSYLCLYLLNPQTIYLYNDIETRYKNLPQPFYSGRCKHVSYIYKFNPKFEQLLLINLHFLYDYRQWLEDYSLIQTPINPFINSVKIPFDNERNLELWTFKLTTNFHEIQFLSNEYFDNYDIYLLKYLYFLYITQTNSEQISPILELYIQQHQIYINAYKYSYWFDLNINSLKKLIEYDPSSSPYVLIYCEEMKKNFIEIFDRLFDYLDYEKNKNDYQAWKLFLENLFLFDIEDKNIIQCIKDNWTIRKLIWKKFHFKSFEKSHYEKAIIAYIFFDDDDEKRSNIQIQWLNNEQTKYADMLHRYLTVLE